MDYLELNMNILNFNRPKMYILIHDDTWMGIYT